MLRDLGQVSPLPGTQFLYLYSEEVGLDDILSNLGWVSLMPPFSFKLLE